MLLAPRVRHLCVDDIRLRYGIICGCTGIFVGAVATRTDACGRRCEEADIIEASRSGLLLCVMSAIGPVGGPFNSRDSFGRILNTNALPLYHMR
jgi:hypothetical protein